MKHHPSCDEKDTFLAMLCTQCGEWESADKVIVVLKDLIRLDDGTDSKDHAGVFGAALDPVRALLRSLGEE